MRDGHIGTMTDDNHIIQLLVNLWISHLLGTPGESELHWNTIRVSVSGEPDTFLDHV